MMNRKIALGMVLIVIIAASIATWVVYTQISKLQAQNSQLRDRLNQVNRVNITDFSSGGWSNPVGVMMAIGFTVTIQNTGISDVGGVTLEIKRLGLDVDPFNITRTLGVIQVGETAEIRELSIRVSLNQYGDEFHGSKFIATLKLGETILDNRTLEVTTIF
jgi:hypothetical protein